MHITRLSKDNGSHHLHVNPDTTNEEHEDGPEDLHETTDQYLDQEPSATNYGTAQHLHEEPTQELNRGSCLPRFATFSHGGAPVARGSPARFVEGRGDV